MHEKYETDYERATQWRDIHNRMQAQRSLRTDDTQPILLCAPCLLGLYKPQHRTPGKPETRNVELFTFVEHMSATRKAQAP